MFCKNCGSKISEGEKFCSNCGTPVEKTEGVTQQDLTQKLTNNAHYDTGVTRYTTQHGDGQPYNGKGYYDSNVQYQAQQVYPQDNPPGKRKRLAILMGVLGVIIVGLALAIGYGVVQIIKLNQEDEIVDVTSTDESTQTEDANQSKDESKDAENRQAYGGHHYQLIDDGKLRWSEAKADCESRGGYLAVVTSAEEEAFIEELVSTGKKDFYWLGATDESSVTNDYLWVTGEVFDYNNWAEGQPDDGDWGVGGRENYIGILRKDNYGVGAYTWNDFRDNPNDSRGYICEWNN